MSILKVRMFFFMALIFCFMANFVSAQEIMVTTEFEEGIQQDRCCKLLAVVRPPEVMCFGPKANKCSPRGTIGGIEVEVCNNQRTTERATVIFNECEYRLDSECREKAETSFYKLAWGTLTCDQIPKDGVCRCTFTKDLPSVSLWPFFALVENADSYKFLACAGPRCQLIGE